MPDMNFQDFIRELESRHYNVGLDAVGSQNVKNCPRIVIQGDIFYQLWGELLPNYYVGNVLFNPNEQGSLEGIMEPMHSYDEAKKYVDAVTAFVKKNSDFKFGFDLKPGRFMIYGPSYVSLSWDSIIKP
jgi:hypothetical protein